MKPEPQIDPEEPPPILRTWPRLYTAVVLYLAGAIILLYLFTLTFNR